ncbi:AsmA family protein [Thiohalobacter sp. IOR34]|uniref:AsmA family protein n=1 Tax=Thiohalobacter sp. IOR34 TaxID=3057176 RepID=UPI0025B01D50|nr:AsmA family protein [Thiohalobacter sp. IOR34]WJW75319.1 AsmA family protein [Thiohalobacter sp. IOR34]
MKPLRLLAYLLAGLVGLLLVAAIALPLLVDPNDYKDEITRLVEDSTGRGLDIQGDLELSVFPWLGVEIGETRLGNAPGFGDQPFARVESVEVRVRLLPLLRKELQMSTLRLDGLQLYLARNADGRSNWDDLLGEAKPAASPGKAEGGAGAPPLAALAIGGIEVADARLVWDDRQAGVRYEIDDLDLELGAIAPGEPVDFRLDFDLKADQPALDGRIDLAGVLAPSADLRRLAVDDLRLGLDLKGDTLPAGALQASLSSSIRLDLDRQTLEVPELVLKALDLSLQGNLKGSGITGKAPAFKGTLTVAEFVPRELLQRLGQPLAVSDPTVLGKADARLGFEATPDVLKLDGIELRLDDSRLNGSATVSHFAKPAIRFDLALDAIDLDRYLPPPAEAGAPAASGDGARAPAAAAPADPAPAVGGKAGGPGAAVATPGEAAAAAGGALPVEALRELDLAGTLRIGRLKAYRLRSSDIRLSVRAKDGQLRLHPAEAKMYDGGYRGDIRLDVRGAQPRIALDEKLSGVQAGPLLKDLLGDDRLLGRADLSARISARGLDPVAMRRTLNGEAAFAFTDGTLKGINVAQLIREAQARLEGRPLPPQTGPNQTDFSELRGTAQIRNGVVYNNDLVAKSPLLRISGKGKIDLPGEQIDYLLTTKIVAALEGQGGAGLEKLKGLAIPLRIKGSFDAPRFNVELDKVLKKVVEKKVRQKLEKKLEDKLGDKLKGLFGR